MVTCCEDARRQFTMTAGIKNFSCPALKNMKQVHF
jgi:hypothetical protein